MQAVGISKELLGARGDVVEERVDAEACNCDENHQKQDNKQQRKNWSKICKTGSSVAGPAAPAVSPDGPACGPVRRFSRRTEIAKNSTNPNFGTRKIDGEIDQIKAGDARGRETITQAMKSMDQNQKKLTQSRDRSRDQSWGFL